MHIVEKKPSKERPHPHYLVSRSAQNEWNQQTHSRMKRRDQNKMNDSPNKKQKQGIVFFPRNGQPMCQDKEAGKAGTN